MITKIILIVLFVWVVEEIKKYAKRKGDKDRDDKTSDF